MPYIRNTLSKVAGIAMCVGIIFSSTVSHADGWPLNIAGTWNVVANQSAGTMVIFQSLVGVCKRITGTIFGTPIDGAYCPGAGTVTFNRYLNVITKVAHQSYRAQLSQDGVVDRMGGSFSQRADLLSLGEFSFVASK
jgi:hypothetical protein